MQKTTAHNMPWFSFTNAYLKRVSIKFISTLYTTESDATNDVS
ncbi:hypothetical protein SAMN02910263_01311 [Butyrivibrio sp. INlla16]|nr:hypothetical protein SAMN02910263_01311 [Butyrivibrio sp. INlla16]SEM05926.1 hypothetical protein SAMN04487770_12474 [Butyrivibrio sp. ob235]